MTREAHPRAGQTITRRQVAALSGFAALSLTAAPAAAQAPASATDWDQAARESHRVNTETLAKFEILMSVEPAFHFKA
jgi:hypothetical protein